MIELLTFLLVLITGYYAWVTRKILLANQRAVDSVREQNEAISRPYIEARLELVDDAPIYVLVIRNNGKTLARNLKLSIDKDFVPMWAKEKHLSEYAAFKQTIESFPPNAELRFELGTGPDVHAKDGKLGDIENFAIGAEYDFSDKKVTEKTIVDFRPYWGSSYPQDPIGQQIKKLREEISKVVKKH